MTEYWICEGESPKELIENVNQKLQQGWELRGDHKMITAGPRHYQTMTREIKIEEPVTGKRAIDLK